MLVRINNPHNRAIRWGVLALEGKARFLAAAPDDQFPHAGSGRVYRDQRLSSLRPSREGFFTVATTVPITRASCMFVNREP